MKYLLLLLIIASLNVNALGPETVELQWSVCNMNVEQVINNLDPQASQRQPSEFKKLNFYDSTDQQLTRHNLQIKSEVSNDTTKFIVKHRTTSSAIKSSHEKCEWDAYSSSRTYACSISEESDLLTERQKTYIKDVAQLDIDSIPLKTYGPFQLTKQQVFSDELKVVVDGIFDYKNNPVTEISVRTTTNEETDVKKVMQKLITDRNISLCQKQEGKFTRLLKSIPASSMVR